jgi:hypothetical protein
LGLWFLVGGAPAPKGPRLSALMTPLSGASQAAQRALFAIETHRVYRYTSDGAGSLAALTHPFTTA